MSGFNLTTGLVIAGFTFQRGDLAVGQFNTIAGYFLFERLQAFFEVLKVMA